MAERNRDADGGPQREVRWTGIAWHKDEHFLELSAHRDAMYDRLLNASAKLDERSGFREGRVHLRTDSP